MYPDVWGMNGARRHESAPAQEVSERRIDQVRIQPSAGDDLPADLFELRNALRLDVATTD